MCIAILSEIAEGKYSKCYIFNILDRVFTSRDIDSPIYIYLTKYAPQFFGSLLIGSVGDLLYLGSPYNLAEMSFVHLFL